MAVVIGTRDGFELVEHDGVGVPPGPRVVRRFAVTDTGRPAAESRPATAPEPPRPAVPADRTRRTGLLRLLAYGVLTAVISACLALTYGYVSGAMTVPERTSVVYVQAGETLWDVAARSAPDSDVDAVVDRIRELNHLTSDEVLPGLALVVPDGREPPSP
ncbi:hypothetical protein GCM10022243_16440 [Saccharothrix violaceirubra]|uniref:Tfp pilus assembly protein FimV n=1 Tax=Saccharothrix violaceirubra TaxID=413306 RepID=A0A7W7WY43_9PSEU|nr:LysM peptidoglycan-binding domain-containing protein [Saccharothrix violaceirubra]MBB4967666.1 Tfp pilus assembly protein FimV [Saccharothrix violaceirubra]